MIKKLRRKFVAITMVSVLMVLVLIMGVINIINYVKVLTDADSILSVLIENGGTFPSQTDKDNAEAATDETSGSDVSFVVPQNSGSKKSGSYWETFKGFFFGDNLLTDETPYMTRYFWVKLSLEKKILDVNVDNIAAVDSFNAKLYATRLATSVPRSGFYQGFKYSIVEKDDCIMCVFLDITSDLSAANNFLFLSLLIGGIGMLLVFAQVWFISSFAIKPMADAYKKQKRFITDASHDIKTPLTIIDANTEIVELENGESEWTEGIHTQVKRLTEMTDKLVFLSRMEEEDYKPEMKEFDISRIFEKEVEWYDARAFSAGKTIVSDIQPNVRYTGNENSIKRMADLLIDNAIKYSSDKSSILVKFYEYGKSKVFLIENKVDKIEKGDQSILFDRFYRSDASRNSTTGGSGIGLSVVSAIATQHKGKAKAESKDGHSLTITITLN